MKLIRNIIRSVTRTPQPVQLKGQKKFVPTKIPGSISEAFYDEVNNEYMLIFSKLKGRNIHLRPFSPENPQAWQTKYSVHQEVIIEHHALAVLSPNSSDPTDTSLKLLFNNTFYNTQIKRYLEEHPNYNVVIEHVDYDTGEVDKEEVVGVAKRLIPMNSDVEKRSYGELEHNYKKLVEAILFRNSQSTT